MIKELEMINSNYAKIMTQFVDWFFSKFTEQNKKNQSIYYYMGIYKHRKNALYNISRKTYSIFLDCKKQGNQFKDIFDKKKEGISKLIFSENEITKETCQKIFEDKNEQFTKKEIDEIKTKYFPFESIENVNQYIAEKSTLGHHCLAVVSINKLDIELAETFCDEYDNNTVCKENFFKCLEEQMKNKGDEKIIETLIQKCLDVCKNELNIFDCIKKLIQEKGFVSDELLKQDSLVKLLQTYDDSRKELMLYLEKPELSELKQIKTELEKMKNESIKDVFNIKSVKSEDVKDIQLDIAEGQIKRVKREEK